MSKLSLKHCTAICIDTHNHDLAVDAFHRCAALCDFKEMLMITDRPVPVPHIIVDGIKSLDDYSKFCIKALGQYFSTSHVLIFQWDGFVLHPDQWSNQYLNYDYIGAPWWFEDSMNVGNGGFSLRSKKLYNTLATMDVDMSLPTGETEGEDRFLCRGLIRAVLEKEHGIRFAPEKVAQHFSKEFSDFGMPTFGFHGFANFPALLGEAATMNVILKKGPEFCTSIRFIGAVHAAANNGKIDLAQKMLQFAADNGKFEAIKQKAPWLPFYGQVRS